MCEGVGVGEREGRRKEWMRVGVEAVDERVSE